MVPASSTAAGVPSRSRRSVLPGAAVPPGPVLQYGHDEDVILAEILAREKREMGAGIRVWAGPPSGPLFRPSLAAALPRNASMACSGPALAGDPGFAPPSNRLYRN